MDRQGYRWDLLKFENAMDFVFARYQCDDVETLPRVMWGQMLTFKVTRIPREKWTDHEELCSVQFAVFSVMVFEFANI